MTKARVLVWAAFMGALGCSSGSQGPDGGGTGSGAAGGTNTGAAGGVGTGVSGAAGTSASAPSAATDTNPANPNVTTMPPASPNGPRVTVAANNDTGAGGGAGDNGTAGVGASAGGGRGAAGAPAGASAGAGGGAAGAPAGTGGSTGAAGVGAAGVGAAGVGATAGAGGAPVDAAAPPPDAAAVDAPPKPQTWETVDCVGGPCGPPGVCVNLDFLFVACAHCGGEDEVCCPPFSADDPFLGTCDPGLVCASNPNFEDDPPRDLVRDVCQIPGSPPAATGGLNHERLKIAP